MKFALLLPIFFLTGCFLWGSAEELPPVYRKDNPSIPAMTLLYPSPHKVYSGRLKLLSSQPTAFVDGPTFREIQRVVVEDSYGCIEGIKDGGFKVKASCEKPFRKKIEDFTDVKVVPNNILKLIGAYEVKSKRALTPVSFICYMILETEDRDQLVTLSFDRIPELLVESTGEKISLLSATPYLESLYCPHHKGSVPWKPNL